LRRLFPSIVISLFAAVLLVLLAGSAEAREPDEGFAFGVRLGTASLDLAADGDTPVIGGMLVEAADRYNLVAQAYNQYHGTSSAQMVDVDDLSLRQDLFLVTPMIRSGSRGYYFRMETPIGVGEDVWSAGVGVYPLNVGIRAGKRVTLHGGAGVIASGVWFTDTDGSSGALLQGRLALGGRIRLGRDSAMTIELGYTVKSIGGVVDEAGIREMEESYDPRGDAAPPPPHELIRGGEQSGLIDLSIGIELD
jgi:hypothetical protein